MKYKLTKTWEVEFEPEAFIEAPGDWDLQVASAIAELESLGELPEKMYLFRDETDTWVDDDEFAGARGKAFCVATWRVISADEVDLTMEVI